MLALLTFITQIGAFSLFVLFYQLKYSTYIYYSQWKHIPKDIKQAFTTNHYFTHG